MVTGYRHEVLIQVADPPQSTGPIAKHCKAENRAKKLRPHQFPSCIENSIRQIKLAPSTCIASMVPPRPQARTVKSTSFDPVQLFDTWTGRSSELLPQEDDLKSSIIKTFGLNESDDYVYHAIASVTLAQVQDAVDKEPGQNGMMHAWYRDADGKQVMK
jgi:hypothetical protein